MPDVTGGYQPDTKSASSRRADFDLQRRIARLEDLVAGLVTLAADHEERLDVLEP